MGLGSQHFKLGVEAREQIVQELSAELFLDVGEHLFIVLLSHVGVEVKC